MLQLNSPLHNVKDKTVELKISMKLQIVQFSELK